MKLLIVTQKVDKNDPILGFFHRWIEEFAKHCKKIIVICLEKGEYNLPANVKVLSLGKEKLKARSYNLEALKKLGYALNFFRYIWQERNNYDAVFVHMNPIYAVLAGWYWRFSGKRTALWYVHKSVDWKLCLAEKVVSRIFTASEESFRLTSTKVLVTGHGIDTEFFNFPSQVKKQDRFFSIVTVGRISQVKGQEMMIRTLPLILEMINSVRLLIVGSPLTRSDVEYENKLRLLVKHLSLNNQVIFNGPLNQSEVVSQLQLADIFVNSSTTGSLDKVVLEAMAVGILVLTDNEAFQKILVKHHYLFLQSPDENFLAQAIITLWRLSPAEKDQIRLYYRNYVCQQHSLNILISKLVADFAQV